MHMCIAILCLKVEQKGCENKPYISLSIPTLFYYSISIIAGIVHNPFNHYMALLAVCDTDAKYLLVCT